MLCYILLKILPFILDYGYEFMPHIYVHAMDLALEDYWKTILKDVVKRVFF
jgi:hypothetical protein